MTRHRWLAVATSVVVLTACTSTAPAQQRPGSTADVTATRAPAPTPLTATTAPALTPSPTPTVARTTTAPSSSSAATTGRPTPEPARTIPPLSAAARAEGLLDVRTLVPDAVIDLRYATRHNFTGVRLYPRRARCLVHRSMAHGLVVAAERLRRAGTVLVFWDCYRPHAVQVRMFQVVPNPDWVARPGPYARSHESARSVDVSLADAGTDRRCRPTVLVQGHCLLDMGTGFDDFTPRAHAFATQDVSAPAQADRTRLRVAMNAGGLTVYPGEWWHFDGPGSDVQRPILAAPVN